MRRAAVLLLSLVASSLTGAAPALADPGPGDPAYTVRDVKNIADSYGRIDGAGGQLQNPAYLSALGLEIGATSTAQLLTQLATPARAAVTAGNLVPGWNVGNPLRAGWGKTRGRMHAVAFTNRYGALLRGHVYKPKLGARDPYTHQKLHAPYPGVVITTGSIQGSEGMYEWLAQDLAERGYVVLTYDVQGQGTSETLPHDNGSPLPFCNPLDTPVENEATGCAGVPFQQESNFVVGTRDALSFFTSTPEKHYRNPGAAGAKVTSFNPYWKLFDRSRDRRSVTPGRTSRIAIIGHSLGAAAVSKVQGYDRRVQTMVALDKLRSAGTKPVVPSLAVQSEYFLNPTPWFASGDGVGPALSPDAPSPGRERASGFDAWQKAGVDSMLLVPRASTHLEYTDIPLVLPASRYGQDLTSVYVQRWLSRYLKHEGSARSLLDKQLRYLEPVGAGRWAPVTLRRDQQLSFYYCSAYAVRGNGPRLRDGDLTGVGC